MNTRSSHTLTDDKMVIALFVCYLFRLFAIRLLHSPREEKRHEKSENNFFERISLEICALHSWVILCNRARALRVQWNVYGNCVRACMLYIDHIHAVQCNWAARSGRTYAHILLQSTRNWAVSMQLQMYYLTIIAMVRFDFIGFVERIHRKREKYLCLCFIQTLRFTFNSIQLVFTAQVLVRKKEQCNQNSHSAVSLRVFFPNVPVVSMRSIASN